MWRRLPKKKKIPLGRKNNGTLEKAAATAAGNGAQQRRAVRKTRTAAGNIPTISKKRKKSSRRTPGLSSYPVLIYLLSSYLYFCTYTEEYVHYMHTITLMPFSFYSLNYNSFRYATRGYSYSAWLWGRKNFMYPTRQNSGSIIPELIKVGVLIGVLYFSFQKEKKVRYLL